VSLETQKSTSGADDHLDFPKNFGIAPPSQSQIIQMPKIKLYVHLVRI